MRCPLHAFVKIYLNNINQKFSLIQKPSYVRVIPRNSVRKSTTGISLRGRVAKPVMQLFLVFTNMGTKSEMIGSTEESRFALN